MLRREQRESHKDISSPDFKNIPLDLLCIALYICVDRDLGRVLIVQRNLSMEDSNAFKGYKVQGVGEE